MDINRLCPGCMREVDGGIQKMRIQGEAPQRPGEAQGQKKCPHCGFCADTYQQNARCLPIHTILAGKYLVGAVLGEGGFGITYMGYDLNMQARIAVKEYFPVELVSRDTTSMTGDRVISLSGDKSATYKQGLKKYVAEAQNVSQFSGIPGVVSVKDFFYENETAYIVMEYIDGISLKDYLKERGGRLSEEESLAIMKPVLETLVKVHEAGIIHRDISPDNIMITRRNVRNADFIAGYRDDAGIGTDRSSYGAGSRDTRAALPGMASAGTEEAEKVVEAASARQARGYGGTTDMMDKGDRAVSNILSVRLIDFGAARMTAKNDQKSLTIILKHGYAPEEQYRTHGEQGPWTDVYAICAVLYRMLTGQTPVPAMDRMFQDELKSFDDLNTKVSRNTQAAILKGLAVKKEDRISDMSELIACLYAGKAVRGMRKGKGTPWLIGAACLGVMAVLAVGLVFVRNHLRIEPPLDGGQLQGTEIAEGGEGTAEGEETDREGKKIEENKINENKTEEIVTFEEEKLGETIAYPNPQTSISAGEGFVLFRMPDGTVQARGKNESGQCMVGEWHDIVAVSAGADYSLGLRSDGKVVAAGNNANGQCEVENWENVVQIAAGYRCSFGLTEGGDVLCSRWYPELQEAEWKDTVAIATDGISFIALNREGSVHSLDGEGFYAATGWEDVRHLYGLKGGDVGTVMGIKEDGTVVYTIKENTGYEPSWVEECGQEMGNWSDIQQICRGYGVRKDGTVESVEFFDDPKMKGTLAQWTEMEGIVDNGSYIFGLKRDGNILEYYSSYDGFEEEMADNAGSKGLEEIFSREELDWIYAIQYKSMDYRLFAGTKDGRTLCYEGFNAFEPDLPQGNGLSGQVRGIEHENINNDLTMLLADGTAYWWHGSASEEGGWIWEQVAEDAVQILPFTQWYHDCAVILKESGQIEVKKFLTTRSETVEAYEKYCADREWDWIDTVESWTDIVQITGDWYDVRYSNNGTVDFYGLHSDGTISTTNPDRQEEIGAYSGISRLVQRGDDILAIREDGTAVVIAASEHAVMFGRTQVTSWSDLQDIAMGGSHVVGLRRDGTVVAAGSNHEGQCDVEDWTDIVYLTTGENCTLGITSNGQLKMAGYLY